MAPPSLARAYIEGDAVMDDAAKDVILAALILAHQRELSPSETVEHLSYALNVSGLKVVPTDKETA